MLVLKRKTGESIVIGEEIRLAVSRVRGNQVALAIEAPAHVRVLRSELLMLVDAAHDVEASSAQSPLHHG